MGSAPALAAGQVVAAADNDRGAVQRLETATVAVQLNGIKAIVTQAIGTGLDIVDAKHQRVETKNIHGYHSIEIVIRRGRSPVVGRGGTSAVRLACRLLGGGVA